MVGGKLFPTQEIGSLKKAPFLRRTITDLQLREVRYWGELLNVENYQRLQDALSRGNYNEKELYDWAALYAIRFFESAGLDVVWDGEQRRSEMYEYAMEQMANIRFVGRVKVWDLETYNKASVTGEISLRERRQIEEFLFAKKHARREVKIPLTGPYTLTDWSFDEYYVNARRDIADVRERLKRSRIDLLYDVARKGVAPLIEELYRLGARRIQIDEPALTTKEDEVETFVDVFNEMRRGIDAVFTVHICYSDYSLLFPHILELKAEELSIECANRDRASLGTSKDVRTGYEILRLFRESGFDKRIVLGTIDVHTDFIETPELVRDRIIYASRVIGNADQIVPSNDCGLRTRRWEVAWEKELSLVKGANLAREIYEGR
ncbi:MAG: hypothetical protein NZ920_02800 [Aigarchaeota archaeon]|nr:hypothetical protein [Aigarchaeota archaeon]MDW8092449.1 hypothetical protein [Nitrososphaerota archaeon]